jgi:hypothetical protein
MYKSLSILFVLMSFVLGACGSGVDEGDNLTDEQKLLVALNGIWVGTADGASTMSGSKRVVFEMALPDDSTPTLEGLSGKIWFGDAIDTSEVDPDFPRIADGAHDGFLRDGFRFSLVNMAIVKDRLLTEFMKEEQWIEFCEAQTMIFEIPPGPDAYSCLPSWGGDCGSVGPNGEDGCIITLPEGGEIFISDGKHEICRDVCLCDATSCTVDMNRISNGEKLDITVDIDNGVLLGTGGLDRIEAVKQ